MFLGSLEKLAATPMAARRSSLSSSSTSSRAAALAACLAAALPPWEETWRASHGTGPPLGLRPSADSGSSGLSKVSTEIVSSLLASSVPHRMHRTNMERFM